jgi:hypothetical protein
VGANTPGRIKSAFLLNSHPLSNSFTSTSVSNLEGAGRIRFARIGDSLLGASDTQISSVTMTPSGGDVLIPVSAFPMPTSTTQLDVVMHWNEVGDLSNVADIILQVESTCGGFLPVSDSCQPSGKGTPPPTLKGTHPSVQVFVDDLVPNIPALRFCFSR